MNRQKCDRHIKSTRMRFCSPLRRRSAALVIIVVEPASSCRAVNEYYDHNNDDDGHNNTKTDPLLLPRCSSTRDSFLNMHIARFEVRVGLLRLGLDILYQRFLLHDDSVEVLEKLVQLHHRALDLDNRVVSLSHVAQS